MRTFKHLTWNDRLKIEQMQRIGMSARKIAEKLHVSNSTISLELKKELIRA